MKKGMSLFLCGLLTASAVVASSSVTALAAPKIDPYNTVQAETNFGSEGVVKSPIVYDGKKITVLDSIDVGDYWYVKDVDFSDGLSRMSLTAKADGPAVIEVRKGSVDGEVLGNFKINTTNGEYKTYTAKMKNVEGSTVLYFVGAYGTASADYWVAEAAEATVTPDPTTGPSVNPYKGVSASLNFGNEGVEYVEEDGSTVAVVEVGDYWRVKDVKFETGTAVVGLKAKADQASAIQLRKGSVDGELLGSFKINASDTYKDYYVNVDKFELEGKTELYFVGVVGKATVKSWNAMLKPGTTQPDPEEPDPVEPDPEPVVTTVNPYNVVEAEDATIMEELEVKTEDGRTYVDWFRPKATYAVKNVEFDGSDKIAITYNSDSAFVLEIHDGAKNGPRLAFLNIPNSDYEWKTITLDFPDLHGVYDLYFVPKFGVIDFDSWQILKEGQQVDPVDPDPVDPDPVDPDPVDPDPVDPDPVDPDPVDPDPIVEQGVTTDYTINNWGSGYQVQVKVTNSSSQKVETWTVKVNKNDVKIDSFWNVKVAEEGNYYVITPVEWNAVLEAGKSTEFGFQGAGSIGDKIELFAEGEVKEDPTPVDPDPVDPDPVDPDPVDPDPVDPDPVDPDPVDPDPVDPDPIVVNEDLTLEYTINGQGSATINFKVANNGTSAVNGWTLKLKKSQLTIDNSWCAKVALVGDYYVITPESWNGVVNAGDGAYFGVQASGITGTTLDYTLE